MEPVEGVVESAGDRAWYSGLLQSSPSLRNRTRSSSRTPRPGRRHQGCTWADRARADRAAPSRLLRPRRPPVPCAGRLGSSKSSPASRRARRLSASSHRSLLVALDHVRVADTSGVRIATSLLQRPALAEQIPALVETDLDRVEPAVVALAQASLGAATVQLLLLADQLLDATVDLALVHLDLLARSLGPTGSLARRSSHTEAGPPEGSDRKSVV